MKDDIGINYKLVFIILMILSLLALVGVYFTEVPNKLPAYFSMASWLLFGAIGYRFLHFARFVVTMFFVINTTFYIYTIYVNGINPIAFAPIASLIALTLLPRILAYFFFEYLCFFATIVTMVASRSG